MRIRFSNTRSGVALIIVLMVIVALGILAGTFAYTMKVETTLARSSTSESEMEWLGRSGVEFSKHVLETSLMNNGGRYQGLSQFWAGGPPGTNELELGLTTTNVNLGRGSFTWHIEDLERKININLADQAILTRALTVMGVDFSAQTPIVNSILDWKDTDDYTLTDGTESDYYMSLSPPYMSKNGPFDDISELLLIRGITEQPALYWGASATNLLEAPRAAGPLGRMHEPVTYPVGLKDLFTTISQGRINVNTASSYVLQVVTGLDESMVQNFFLNQRIGPDQVEGTEDDLLFPDSSMFSSLSGGGGQGGNIASLGVQSATFEVTITAELGGRTQQFVAIVVRRNAREYHTLSFVRK